MRIIFCLLTLAAAAWLLAGCEVEPLEGCTSNANCRFGRVCDDGLCVWPDDTDLPDQRVTPDGGRPDAGRDVAPDRGGDARPDRGRGAQLVVSPEVIDFGVLPPGSRATNDVRIVNLGDAAAVVSAVVIREELFEVEGFPDDGLTLGVGQSISFDVVLRLPADVPVGSTIRDTLVVEAGVDSPNPISIVVVVDEGELCVNLVGPRTLSLDEGEQSDVEFRVEICGEVPIVFERLAIEALGDAASIDIVSLPREGTEIAVGESLPILAVASGDRAGRTSFRFLLAYTAAGRERQLDVPLTIIVGQECGAPPLLTADRGGPSSDDGSLELEIGHQIRIESHDGTLLEDVEPVVLPEGSDATLAQLPDEGAWQLVPDRPGVYRLNVLSLGETGCVGEHEVEIVVQNPPSQFAAWVTWHGAGARGADLDLYLARQTDEGYLWETRGEAVGPQNRQADFGDPGVFQDNPRYVFDYNSQGWGPEQVRIPAPDGDEILALGVHAFSVPDAAMSVEARVYVQLGEELHGPLTADLQSGQFWIIVETQGTALLGDYDLIVDGFPDPNLP